MKPSLTALGLALLAALACSAPGLITRPTGTPPPRATATSLPSAPTPTGQPPTPTFCPQATQALLSVDPIPASTDQPSVVVTVDYGWEGEVTIVAESGTFTGSLSASGPAQIEVRLLPNATHHLKVTAVIPVSGPSSCTFGGYTVSSDVDNQGAPLTITQGAAPPGSLTPTICPEATAEPFWVDPIPTSTLESSVVVSVYIGNGEEVTIVTESGTFAATGSFSSITPARVEVKLMGNTTHHLQVTAKVKEGPGFAGCTYGGYTLSTTLDRNGAPLVITLYPK